MSTAITRASVERLKNRLASMREEAKAAAKTGVTSLVIVGGGAAAGAIQAKFPFLPGTSVPTAAAVGTALVAAAMTGMLEDQTDHVASFGAGMLAAIAAKETEKVLKAA
jgi:hypothetical protein